jgi:acyl carrier protein
LEERIKLIFATVLNISPDQVHDETKPDDLENWDSMNHLLLVAAFEDEFSINIEPEEIGDMWKNYTAFKKLIMQKVAQQ